MSTAWHPRTKPPEAFRSVWLRFGDDGERDVIGFFHDVHRAYYTSVTAMKLPAPVHPTHWAEIQEPKDA